MTALTGFEIAVHSYSIATIIPTLLANILLAYLLVRQDSSQRNKLEYILISVVCTMDLIFSLNIIIRYIWIFGHDLSSLHIINSENESRKPLSESSQFTCNWSGTILAITMHSSTYILAVLSYARYSNIVKQRDHTKLFWILILSIPCGLIFVLSVFGAAADLYNMMPGGLGCHIWSASRNDPRRTPIQIFFSYNILLSLLVMSYCYINILLHHNRTVVRMEERFIKYRRNNKSNNLHQLETSKYEDSEVEDSDVERIPIDQLDAAPTNPQMVLKRQQSKVNRRVLMILGAYFLCHLPECTLEQMEILLGLARSASVDSICTHFRSLYGLFNAMLVLALHTHTRDQLKLLVRSIRNLFGLDNNPSRI